MKLLNLTLTNFQGIRALSLDLPDGCSAGIYGDNATGKTTVFNAFTWLLLDKSSTGAKNFTPKTKGQDGDLHNLEHSANATLEADDGRVFTLKKTFKEVYKKKRGSAHEEFDGHTTDYFVDGVPVKEKDYSTIVTAYCGGDLEKIKLLTMPDYFPEGLPWEDRRRRLLEICGDITDEDIIAGNDALRELWDYLRMPGGGDRFYTTDEYRKIASARKSDLNRQLAQIPGRIDEATRAKPDITGMDAVALEQRIADLRREREALAGKKAAASAGDTATAELRRKRAEMQAVLAESRAHHIRQQNEKNATVDADILTAEREITKIRQEIEDHELAKRRKSAERDRMKSLREQLLEDYRRASAEVFNERQTVCPTCGQVLPVEQVEQMREEFNIRKSKLLEEINHRGKTEADKSAIAALEETLRSLGEQMQEAEKDLSAAEARLNELAGKRVPPVPFENTEEYAALAPQLDEIYEKLRDAGKCIADASDAVEAEIRATDEAIREAQGELLQITMAQTQQKRIEELEAQEKALNAEYEDTEKGLYLCDLFTRAKVSALTERINGKFKNVRFRLFQEQLNGGVKEDCEVMIPADGRLVPYSLANNAARINAGLEIIDTLGEHFGIRMPVFIDNAESVTKLTKIGTQTIRLVVSEEDKSLRLEPENR